MQTLPQVWNLREGRQEGYFILMATVWIPALMRDLTGGREKVTAPGKTLGEVIAALEEAYPGAKGRLCQGERLDPALMVSLDGRVGRLGLWEAVREGSEIRFLPAVGGG